MTNKITLTKPDDWHLHVRDGDVLNDVVPYTAKQFARAIIMPNLKPPVTTTEQALNYRDRVLSALPVGTEFEALMTLYLTDNTDIDEIHRAAESEHVHAVKYYPAGATTNSDSGVTDITKAYPAIKAMAESGLPLLVHGEVTDPGVDIFDREAVFIERVLKPVLDAIPDLKLVMEHITTKQAAEFVQQAGDNVAATITPQHLLYNRNAIFQGGIRPHYFCLPILKREQHREALVEAATSGSSRYFLGTDSAPHAQSTKESSCGCAGMFSAYSAIELYTEAFEKAGALDKLEGFASHHGPDFYGLPRNTDTITLAKEEWTVPDKLPFANETIVPMRAGEQVGWKLA
ncbi:MAG: dihydroorotase [Gammaproteobacteria bacterium]